MVARRRRSWVVTALLALAGHDGAAAGAATGPAEAPDAPRASDAPPAAGAVRVAPADGMRMVFVPAGRFTMGAPSADPAAEAQERPAHAVELSGYWIDETEVTHRMFAAFVAATGHTTVAELAGRTSGFVDGRHHAAIPGGSWRNPGGTVRPASPAPDHPVVAVAWADAEAYCRWAGRRLPTEAEWEKAARGAGGRRFPWGDAPVDGTRANTADRASGIGWADPAIDDGFATTAPVGRFAAGAGPFGTLDQAGNVWEWVWDRYDARAYDRAVGVRDPVVGPGGAAPAAVPHVLRGGGFADDAAHVRSTRRATNADARHTSNDGGFRCAASWLASRAALPILSRAVVWHTPVPTTPPRPTPLPPPTVVPPTAVATRPPACDQPIGEGYRLLPITHEARLDPADDPEVNIALRGWKAVDEARRLVRICGPVDGDAPQLDGLFGDRRVPGFTSTHAVYTLGGRAGGRTEPTAWPVHLAGMATAPGEVIRAPRRGPDIDSGTVHAIVLFADHDSLTLKYTREDVVLATNPGYAVHLENVCPAPELTAQYARARRDFGRRRELPAVASHQPVARSLGGEILVSVRDSASFMDPRSGKDWWVDHWREPPCGLWERLMAPGGRGW